jgi:alpha-L-fucosidase 2
MIYHAPPVHGRRSRPPYRRPAAATARSGARLAALTCSLLLVAVAAPGRAQSPDGHLALWYDRPAAEWIEALPVGNGRLGAMVFGGVAGERIQFNEATLWSGGPHDYDHPGASAVLPRLRALLFEGRQAGADSLASASFMSVPLTQASYQAFGDLHLRSLGPDTSFTDYRRDLDLARAVATTRYRSGATTYTREVFASHPAGVIVVRLTADRPGRVSVAVSLTSAHAGALRRRAGPDGLSLAGVVENGAIRYEARLLVRNSGGRVSLTDTVATVSGADTVTLILAGATNFVRYDDVSADPVARTDTTLGAVRAASFARLLDDHTADHRGLFDRMSIDVGASDPATAALPTDARLAAFASHGDPGLVALVFQYGR